MLCTYVKKIFTPWWNAAKDAKVKLLAFPQVIISAVGDLCKIILVSNIAENIFRTVKSKSKHREIIKSYIDLVIAGELRF